MSTQQSNVIQTGFKPGAVVVGLVAVVVFVADQITKYLVDSRIGLGGVVYPIEGFDWVRLIPGMNTGTACGYFPQFSIVFTLAPFFILAIVIAFYRAQRQPSWLLSIGTGLIIGGAFGNLTDRLRLGYVLDFVQVGNWPVFNIADAAISTAVVLMLLWSLREDASLSAQTAPDAEGGAARQASSTSWKLLLSFVAIMVVIAVAGFVLCVYVPSNFIR